MHTNSRRRLQCGYFGQTAETLLAPFKGQMLLIAPTGAVMDPEVQRMGAGF